MNAVAPEIVDRPEIHLAVVRATVAFSEIPALYDRAYPLIFGALAAAGIAPAAAPMGVVHGTPDDGLDLSVAVPVREPFSAPAEASAEVSAETIPASRTATLLVRGDYEQLSGAYQRIHAWIAEQGFEPTGVSWEQYLTEPKPGGDPSENETLVGVLVQ